MYTPSNVPAYTTERAHRFNRKLVHRRLSYPIHAEVFCGAQRYHMNTHTLHSPCCLVNVYQCHPPVSINNLTVLFLERQGRRLASSVTKGVNKCAELIQEGSQIFQPLNNNAHGVFAAACSIKSLG